MLDRSPFRWHLVPLALLLWAGPASSRVGAQGPASAGARAAVVAGQVTDSASGTPLPNAEVFVVTPPGAAPRGARTGANGRYTITGVAAGPQTVRVRLLGYAAADRQVTARNVEQLVGSRTPGVIVLPATGQVGTGAQLRIRQATSLSLSNDPLIYIDGVRMDASAARGQAQRGGAGASRLNDVNPEDIESIEILKGPAASTLYGTEASNGVIQIITKRGRSGKASWDFTTR